MQTDDAVEVPYELVTQSAYEAFLLENQEPGQVVYGLTKRERDKARRSRNQGVLDRLHESGLLEKYAMKAENWLGKMANPPEIRSLRDVLTYLTRMSRMLDEIANLNGRGQPAQETPFFGYNDDVQPRLSGTAASEQLRGVLERLYQFYIRQEREALCWAMALKREDENRFKEERQKILMFCGRFYGFGTRLGLDPLVLPTPQLAGLRADVNEQLYARARLSTSLDAQQAWFEIVPKLLETDYAEKGLWGLGRMLVWYGDFEGLTARTVDYRDLTIRIARCGARNIRSADGLHQNALLSLIYLLSFSEYNAEFLAEGSEERKACETYLKALTSRPPISLKQVSSTESLNAILDSFLAGKAIASELRTSLLSLA